MKKILLNLDPKIDERLSILSLAVNMSKTDLIRKAVAALVAGNEKKIEQYIQQIERKTK